jgi:DNA-binding IclR family transcriptional regulator
MRNGGALRAESIEALARGQESARLGGVSADPDAASAGGRRDRIQSLDRAVALLRAIAAAEPGEATLQSLAEDTGLKRSTAWRLLATLEHHGLVDRLGGGYAIGYTAAQLATASTVEAVVRRSHPVLERIATLSGETANLALARGLGLYYVDQAVSHHIVSTSWLGRHVPLHATSSGKAFLAWLSEPELAEVLADALPAYTPATITDCEALRADLAESRARGYAVCTGELEPDSYGVSAPVLDQAGRPVAAVAIWGPLIRVPPHRFGALGEIAIGAAAEIAGLLELATPAA